MIPNHSLLPDLRRRRFMAAEGLRNALALLNHAQAGVNKAQTLVDELDQQIAENDFYHPPRRPSV